MEGDPVAALDNSEQRKWSFHLKVMILGHDAILSASKRQKLHKHLPELVLTDGRCTEHPGPWAAFTFSIPNATAYQALAKGYISVRNAFEVIDFTQAVVMDARITDQSIPSEEAGSNRIDITAEVMALEQGFRELDAT